MISGDPQTLRSKSCHVKHERRASGTTEIKPSRIAFTYEKEAALNANNQHTTNRTNVHQSTQNYPFSQNSDARERWCLNFQSILLVLRDVAPESEGGGALNDSSLIINTLSCQLIKSFLKMLPIK